MKKILVELSSDKIEDILGMVGGPSIVLSELIKNSIDSNSKIIDICIYTNEKEIIVIDKGDGLDNTDIEKLGIIGESDKKEVGKKQRKNGEYYSGSKGLGLLSAFSLSSNIEIQTRKANKSYVINWEKSQGGFSYKEIEQLPHCGTKLIMKNISQDDINVLTDEEEYRKLRHFSICHFKNMGNMSEEVNFYIDDQPMDKFKCCDIKSIEDEFVYEVKFRYYSESNKLKFQFVKVNMSNSGKINKNNALPIDRLFEEMTISLNEKNKVNEIIKEKYKITKTVNRSSMLFKYLNANLESFEGMFYVSEGRKDNKDLMDGFGYGVKVFANNFAVYDYLDNENDWLGFGPLSQLGKSTTLKPHNVFGYVNFGEFNEKKSSLKIANERTNFIQKAPYKKFIEIMKGIIVKILFEVDVAYRNDNIEIKDYLVDFHNEDLNEIVDKDSKRDNNDKYEKNIVNEKSNENDKLKRRDNDNKRGDNKGEIQKETISDNKLNIKNPAKCRIKLKSKPMFNFFTTSNIIKINETISIEYNELIKQLKRIFQSKEFEYKDFYLIFVMAFRTILEDISKTYLNTRQLKLYGDFGQNIRAMTDDMLTVIKNTELIDKQNKDDIERIFGGYNPYKNFLKAIGDDFYNNGQQGIKATKLNSFIHTPRWMEMEEAESISNDVILPLIVASQEILKRIKKLN